MRTTGEIKKPYRGAGRGAGSDGLSGQSGLSSLSGRSNVCGSTYERDQTAPPIPARFYLQPSSLRRRDRTAAGTHIDLPVLTAPLRPIAVLARFHARRALKEMAVGYLPTPWQRTMLLP